MRERMGARVLMVLSTIQGGVMYLLVFTQEDKLPQGIGLVPFDIL